jgi:hypothetical protein
MFAKRKIPDEECPTKNGPEAFLSGVYPSVFFANTVASKTYQIL